ncbi:hypothetical protein GCM10010832_15550 [Psychroflexus planctonicus]|uniref:Uncharacterized protein n=1 Tax=Psychroflexus planctonicus TaxID=1526575 RepID=A0ABQ1SJ49_9FLAO|nr:hypothetical protein GCM10010832_15550 [Psychroflexus planctonicus]
MISIMSIENILALIAFFLLCIVFYVEYKTRYQSNKLKMYKKHKRTFLIFSLVLVVAAFIILSLLDVSYSIGERLYLTNLFFVLFAALFYLYIHRTRIRKLFQF